MLERGQIVIAAALGVPGETLEQPVEQQTRHAVGFGDDGERAVFRVVGGAAGIDAVESAVQFGQRDRWIAIIDEIIGDPAECVERGGWMPYASGKQKRCGIEAARSTVQQGAAGGEVGAVDHAGTTACGISRSSTLAEQSTPGARRRDGCRRRRGRGSSHPHSGCGAEPGALGQQRLHREGGATAWDSNRVSKSAGVMIFEVTIASPRPGSTVRSSSAWIAARYGSACTAQSVPLCRFGTGDST